MGSAGVLQRKKEGGKGHQIETPRKESSPTKRRGFPLPDGVVKKVCGGPHAREKKGGKRNPKLHLKRMGPTILKKTGAKG